MWYNGEYFAHSQQHEGISHPDLLAILGNSAKPDFWGLYWEISIAHAISGVKDPEQCP